MRYKILILGLLATLLFPIVSGGLTGFSSHTRDGKKIKIYFEEDDGYDDFVERDEADFEDAVNEVINNHNLSFILANRSVIAKEIKLVYENGSWGSMTDIRIARIKYHDDDGRLITKDWEKTWMGWVWWTVIIIGLIIAVCGVIICGLACGEVDDGVGIALFILAIAYISTLPATLTWFGWPFYVASGIAIIWGSILGIIWFVGWRNTVRANSKTVVVKAKSDDGIIVRDKVVINFEELERDIKNNERVCQAVKNDLEDAMKRLDFQIEKSKQYTPRLKKLKQKICPPVRDIGEGRILHFRRN